MEQNLSWKSNGTRRLVIVFTKARPLPLCCSRLIQSRPCHSIAVRFILITFKYPKWLFGSGFSTKKSICISLLPHTFHFSCSFHLFYRAKQVSFRHSTSGKKTLPSKLRTSGMWVLGWACSLQYCWNHEFNYSLHIKNLSGADIRSIYKLEKKLKNISTF